MEAIWDDSTPPRVKINVEIPGDSKKLALPTSILEIIIRFKKKYQYVATVVGNGFV